MPVSEFDSTTESPYPKLLTLNFDWALKNEKKKEKKKQGYSPNVLLATHRGRFCLWVIDHASAVDSCSKIVYKQQKDKHLPLDFTKTVATQVNS